MSPKIGNGADQHADAEIDGHAHQGDIGNAANPGGERNHQREQAGQHVAEAGNQADDAVNAKADLGAGDAKGLVEQDLEPLQSLVAEEPCAAIPAAGPARRRGCRTGLSASLAAILALLRMALPPAGLAAATSASMLQSIGYMAAIVQRQNA